MRKLLIFHPTIPPYRIDFFNDLYNTFDAKICLFYENLKDQKFQYDAILKQLIFTPDYFTKSVKLLGREIPVGFIRRLKKHRPDVVIVNEYNESCWISILYRFFSGRQFKIISICDDSADIICNEGGLHAKARALAMKHIDGIILCNDCAEKIYRSKYPKVKTVVMPIIQDEKNFFTQKERIVGRAKEIIREENLEGKRVFLYVGRISPEKNPLFLVNSFVSEHDKHPENILYLIGSHIPENKAYNDEIDEYIKSYNASSYIRKIGRREGDELKSWFYAGQILTVPSTREPFGAVVNEALLCGDYVILSSIAGSSCLIDETNGTIIDVHSGKIDFNSANIRVPLLTMDYIDLKGNKMKYSYHECMNHLAEWIEII